jgi:isoleucyl-tRNA synthetase
MAPCPLDDGGKFIKPVTDFEGTHIKVCYHSWIKLFRRMLTIGLQVADKEIMKVLKTKGRLIVQSTIKHSYPFCWR